MVKTQRTETKISKAWNKIFDELDLLSKVANDGFIKLSSGQLKSISGEEPRLLAKFDHQYQLPNVFSRNGLSILPDTRGTYIVGKFNAYKKIEFETKIPQKIVFPEIVRTIDPANITSESIALNVAHASGMIDEVMNSSGVHSVLTLSGRMKSGNFQYYIGDKKNNQQIIVNNSQIEIDATYENNEKIVILEAKNRAPMDFLVRQLYYPYRLLKSKDTGKELIPIYFTYVDDIFSFSIFEFEDDNYYSSIKKVKQFDFVLEVEEARFLDLEEIERIYIEFRDKPVKEIATFPQADSFSRVMDLLDFLEESKTKAEITEKYKFNERQADYYFNSLVYLGLGKPIIRGKPRELTEEGQRIRRMNNSAVRNRILIRSILCHKPFNLIYRYYMDNFGDYDRKNVEQIIKLYGVDAKGNHFNNGSSTLKRRTSTAIAWVQWIIANIE